MNILWYIIVGVIAGALAKALMPGTDREPKGCLMTMLLGIAGAVVMGLLADMFLGGGSGTLIGSLIGATIGAMILIFLARKFWK
ncbi:MAG TPA: GlsB/YeaQ/YmgE family stress response membrane protein [Fimbriimonas sp.]|nr:GlsB/YeaQ/YmgE family stress response membrane protein [Fimbriimonas sp.]